MKLDYINGSFEFLGSIAIWRSVYLLYCQKHVQGVSIYTIGFFMLWGVFNLLYYPSLLQWYSFYGGCSIVFANLIWVIQMIYYSYKERENMRLERIMNR